MVKQSKDNTVLVVVFVIVILLLIGGFTFGLIYVHDTLKKDFNDKLVVLNENILGSMHELQMYLENDIHNVHVNLSMKQSVLESNLNFFKKQNEKEINTLNDLITQIEMQSDIKLQELKDEVSNIKVKSDDFTGIIEDVLESVVSVGTNRGVGSGAIIDEEGFIVTNLHVVDGASIIRVLTYDGTVRDAILVGFDRTVDIALLKIDASGLEDLKYDDSDDIKVGEKVIALGNPAGLSFSVTEGIVSAVKRRGPNDLNIYIQTDVPINPGNSGGPLVNTRGRIIGINNWKVGGFEGLGFAIESNVVEEVTDNLIEQYYELVGE